ncbi:hypothetical protein [Spiroplasma endosymbiont of Polydrusus formosus]|uniref:hypothetical protein n=1 Tax=Spiroplasma endosymbiont of Polydrusus formosus TaxID=3139326 RepID=UPI0035B504BF
MKIVIKTKKAGCKQKTLNKIYYEIINYLINYEHYSPDIITNIIRNIDKNFICSKTLFMFTFSRYNFNKKIY